MVELRLWTGKHGAAALAHFVRQRPTLERLAPPGYPFAVGRPSFNQNVATASSIPLRPTQVGPMPTFMFYLTPFMPLLATIPLAVVAIWIANRWFRLRRGDPELRAEIAALRDEVEALRQEQAETQERLDFTERLVSDLREAHSALPRSS